MDQLREDIRLLAGPAEYRMLYGEQASDRIPGSVSKCTHAKPIVVLYWIQIAITRCAKSHGVPGPIVNGFATKISSMGDQFWAMNKIDKTQFPFPYAQVVKILCTLFVFTLPFSLHSRTGDLTEIFVAIIAMGFFGLDETAEMMESPFGVDPNALDLKASGRELMFDMEMMYHGRNTQLDTVFAFGDENELNFQQVLRANSCRRKCQLRQQEQELDQQEAFMKVFSGRTDGKLDAAEPQKPKEPGSQPDPGVQRSSGRRWERRKKNNDVAGQPSEIQRLRTVARLGMRASRTLVSQSDHPLTPY
jgi:hypothetical protein